MKRRAVLFIIAPGLAVSWLLGKVIGRKGGLGADGVDDWTTIVILLTLLAEIVLLALGAWWVLA